MNKQVIVLLSFIVVLTALFWSDSRYPALDSKAVMGGSTQLEDPLSFEATIQLQADDGVVRRILLITWNWVNTNLQGMTFGLLLGAAFLSLIKLIRHKIQFKNSLLNTLVGIFTGAPLGVCVNCAAPIAKGMHEAGAKLETSLATLISSPTLNIIVITMMFTLFPIYVALTKIAATFVLLLIFIPLIVRFFPTQKMHQEDLNASCPLPMGEPTHQTWPQAIKTSSQTYLLSLWYIFRTAVPLMLLAGLLGAIVITFLPLESLIDWPVSFVGVLIVALLGVFLPVPIAFDIIVSATLLAAGLPMVYVMLLLFTLGSFSIYSFFIVWRTVSIRVASSLYAAVAISGICAGLIADVYHETDLDDMLDVLINEAQAGELTPQRPAVELIQQALQTSSTSTSNAPFTRMEGRDIGLDLPNLFSISEFLPPYYMGRGLAGGDFNNDGWQDIVVASKQGVVFYQNQKGKRFNRYEALNSNSGVFDTFVVSLVDINNDGWLDVYFTTLHEGNYYLLNHQGEFDFEKMKKTPTTDNVLTYALAFADIDKDGDLDVVIGNWNFSLNKKLPPEITKNEIHKTIDGEFVKSFLDEPNGETLSVLLSDYDSDGNLDLIVANDFDTPDFFYLGDGKGAFHPIYKQRHLIATSTDTTMSIDTADIDNDLTLEIYLSQIAPGLPNNINRVKARSRQSYCDDFSEGMDKQVCENNVVARNIIKYGPMHRAKHIKKCKTISNVNERQACMAITVTKTAGRRKRPDLCGRIPASQTSVMRICRDRFKTGSPLTQEELARSIPIKINQNVLLKRNAKQEFIDQAETLGIDQSAWSWNAKFADLDNDQWQDLYIVNGIWIREESVPSNVFFHNDQGRFFTEKTTEFGLEHYIIDTAYIYIDYDNDGDLDIVKNSINGPLWLFKNNESHNQAAEFSVNDTEGNYYGIGSKLIIHYGPEAKLHQIREIKTSGGYISFDPLIAHFGLGEYKKIKKIEIIWSTGERNEWVGEYASNQHFTLKRGISLK